MILENNQRWCNDNDSGLLSARLRERKKYDFLVFSFFGLICTMLRVRHTTFPPPSAGRSTKKKESKKNAATSAHCGEGVGVAFS